MLRNGLLKPADENVVAALARLKENKDWAIISGWMEDSLKTLGCNKYPDDFAARWAQGQGQAISELMLRVETAREDLEDMKKEQS